MYCLVLRQLNPIQKGIQAAHSIVDYSTHYFMTDLYTDWSLNDKTIIMLDGGIAQDMEQLRIDLSQLGVKIGIFREPDLMDLITSICLIVDEKIWNDDYESILSEKSRKLKEILNSHHLSH